MPINPEKKPIIDPINKEITKLFFKMFFGFCSLKNIILKIMLRV